MHTLVYTRARCTCLHRYLWYTIILVLWSKRKVRLGYEFGDLPVLVFPSRFVVRINILVVYSASGAPIPRPHPVTSYYCSERCLISHIPSMVLDFTTERIPHSFRVRPACDKSTLLVFISRKALKTDGHPTVLLYDHRYIDSFQATTRNGSCQSSAN